MSNHTIDGKKPLSKMLAFLELLAAIASVATVLDLLGIGPWSKYHQTGANKLDSISDWIFLVFLFFLATLHVLMTGLFIWEAGKRKFVAGDVVIAVHGYFPIFSLTHTFAMVCAYQMLQIKVEWYVLIVLGLFRCMCSLYLHRGPERWESFELGNNEVLSLPHDEASPEQHNQESPPHGNVSHPDNDENESLNQILLCLELFAVIVGVLTVLELLGMGPISKYHRTEFNTVSDWIFVRFLILLVATNVWMMGLFMWEACMVRFKDNFVPGNTVMAVHGVYSVIGVVQTLALVSAFQMLQIKLDWFVTILLGVLRCVWVVGFLRDDEEEVGNQESDQLALPHEQESTRSFPQDEASPPFDEESPPFDEESPPFDEEWPPYDGESSSNEEESSDEESGIYENEPALNELSASGSSINSNDA